MADNEHTLAGVMDRNSTGADLDEYHRPLGVRDDRCKGT